MISNTDVHTCSYYCERPECVRRQRDELRDRLESVLAGVPQQSAAREWVLVPMEPSEGVLVSMAIRYDHGLGVPGYYDQPLFGGENGGHKRRMESTVAKMRQLYEEVVGAGFYSREREEEYAALSQQPAGVTEEMVERAGRVLYGTDWGSFERWEADQLKRKVRAVLTAALAAQQQGGA